MKKIAIAIVLCCSLNANAQKTKGESIRTILLEQLKTTHNKQDWFVPVINSLQGLTIEQANWKPNDSSHSVAQLAAHLLFWNKNQLDKFKNNKEDAFDGNNEKTFANLTAEEWQSTVKQLDDVLTEWEKIVATTDETKLTKWYNIVAHISTHNAYHTGQILYVRKLQGSWNPDKGVK